MKKLVLIGAGLLLGASLHAAEVKFGYVDLNRAIQNTSLGKKIKSDIESEYNKRKKDIETRQADIRKMGEDLEKKRAVLSEEAMAKKQADINEEMMKFNELVRKSQEEFGKKQADLTAPVLEKMKKIMDKVAKDDAFTMIFEKNEQSVLWARADMDLTDRIVKEFEKSK